MIFRNDPCSNAKPLRFSPAGLSDALAEEDAFPGACSVLTNLVPDPSTKNLWAVRPASTLETAFGSFNTPTGVSVFKVVGDYVFGLVSSAHYPGYDEPFCFDLTTGLFVTVTGVTSSNVPATQSTTGEWTPPTMDVVGTFVYVTHPGFDGVTNFVGYFDIETLTAPTWTAGNMSLVTPISAVSISSGGSGYVNGYYTNVPLIGGTGAGAEADFTVAGGIITLVTIINGGLGYVVGDTLAASSTILGAAGSGLQLAVTAVVGSGIQAVNITGLGSGYTTGVYTNIALAGGAGSGATANINVNAGGSVNSVAIVDPGGGYTVGNTLTVSGAGVATLGSLTGGSVYTDGTYYNVPLTGGVGSGVTATITISGGVVTTVVVDTPGAGYDIGDVLSAGGGGVAAVVIQSSSPQPGYVLLAGTYPNIAGDNSTSKTASGVVATVVVSGVGASAYVSSVTITTPGQGYTVGDTVIFSSPLFGGGANTTVGTLTAGGALGPGTGFSVAVASVTPIPIGNGGTGFSVQVVAVTNPGGYINFTTIPSWIRQFNGRAWFGVNPTSGSFIPSVIFTDPYAFNCTNANQVLTFGDTTPLTAAAALPLSNLLGGVVQSLIIFKQYENIVQITGDYSTDNINVNAVPGGSGTLSPRSVTTHPQGLLYLDKDGFRIVTLDGTCTDPIGFAGQGVTVPFLNPTYRSRVNAACNGTVLRVSVQNSLEAGAWQEYWYDLVRKVWSGPHTFPAIMIDTYEGDFILAPQSAQPSLYRGATAPVASSSFVENGNALSWIYQTSVLMDNQQMAQSEIAETQIKLNAAPGLTSIGVSAIDQDGNVLGSALQSLFGQGTGITARQVDFPLPVVYNRLALQFVGASVAGFQIGDAYVRASSPWLPPSNISYGVEHGDWDNSRHRCRSLSHWYSCHRYG